MFEPIGHQHRFPVGSFDQILQGVQLPVVNPDLLLVVIVDRTVCHLQELAGEGGCVCDRDFLLRKLQYQRCPKLLVPFAFIIGQIHHAVVHNELRHLQVIGCLHGNGDIRDLLVDRLVRTGQELVGVDDLAVPLVRGEVVVAVHPDKATESLTHVQNLEFCPQVHEAVRGRGTGQPDNPLYPWPHPHQSLKAL